MLARALYSRKEVLTMRKDMLGIAVRKLVTFPNEELGIVCDLLEKFSNPVWVEATKKFLRKENYWTGATENFLKLISGGETINIAAVDGTETLADAKDVFLYIDSDFKNWGTNEPGQSTAETSVGVYEMAKDATFAQMFGNLNADVKKLCLTQHQIKKFVVEHRKWLREDGYGTFFLFQSNDNFYVASVDFFSADVLYVSLNRFGRSFVWRAEYRHRVVVPQLA